MTVAHADDFARSFEIELNLVVGDGHDPPFAIDDGDGDDGQVLAVGVDGGAIRDQLDPDRRRSRFDLLLRRETSAFVSLGDERPRAYFTFQATCEFAGIVCRPRLVPLRSSSTSSKLLKRGRRFLPFLAGPVPVREECSTGVSLHQAW